MSDDLFERVIIQLEPELAQEFGYAILEDRKKLKALEIIIEKDVDIYFFKESLKFPEYAQLMEYNTRSTELIELTQEEYDLLKEAL